MKARHWKRTFKLKIHFDSLKRFAKMKNKDLMLKRTLDSYLVETKALKMQERIIEVLRRNLNKKLKK